MKILYAGDSEIGGPADYLFGILKHINARVTHIPPSKKLSPSLFKTRFDAIILSDFSKANTLQAAERAIVSQVDDGTGLLMVGGWGSFSGPFGKWRGSAIERILPVNCLAKDDRMNFPGGAWIIKRKAHLMFRAVNFKNPPVICGLNQVRPKRGARVILTARRIVDRREFPLLVIDSDPTRRIAAFTTDFAPHWCGGLVDWGNKHLKLHIKDEVLVEVGDRYIRFVSSLIKWLAKGLG